VTNTRARAAPPHAADPAFAAVIFDMDGHHRHRRPARPAKASTFGAMAGTVHLVLRCFAGLETRDDRLWLQPVLTTRAVQGRIQHPSTAASS
jgi:trehalose/maltose hydrolase-like predicted phosphorylase